MHKKVCEILGLIGQPQSPIRPTELYNEGWMLRLLLEWAQHSATHGHPLFFEPQASWFSEALLPSQFLARHRGDPLAETWTNADGVMGHFTIGNTGKGDLTVLPTATQFTVIEAKMFSGLSSGTKRAPNFHQAARNVACIAEVLSRANRAPSSFSILAFYVFAPASQINKGVFGSKVTRDDIYDKVKERTKSFGGEKDVRFTEWFIPTLERIQLQLYPWEDVIHDLDQEYMDFYENCLRYNQGRLKN